MIVSFLISQQNNIPRIRRCISNICERYGERRQGQQGKEFIILSPGRRPWQRSVRKNCGTAIWGYRSRYVKKTAQMILDGQVSLESVRKLDYPQARGRTAKTLRSGYESGRLYLSLCSSSDGGFPCRHAISVRPWKSTIPRDFPLRDIKDAAGSCSSTYFTENFFSKIKSGQAMEDVRNACIGASDFG